MENWVQEGKLRLSEALGRQQKGGRGVQNFLARTQKVVVLASADPDPSRLRFSEILLRKIFWWFSTCFPLPTTIILNKWFFFSWYSPAYLLLMIIRIFTMSQIHMNWLAFFISIVLQHSLILSSMFQDKLEHAISFSLSVYKYEKGHGEEGISATPPPPLKCIQRSPFHAFFPFCFLVQLGSRF